MTTIAPVIEAARRRATAVETLAPPPAMTEALEALAGRVAMLP